VAFVDLVDSTAWTAAARPQDHNEALLAFERLAWEGAVSHGGRLIKLIGDEAMIVSPDPATAARIASELCQKATAHPLLPAARGAVGSVRSQHAVGTSSDGSSTSSLERQENRVQERL
jgi:adenylate cyclase